MSNDDPLKKYFTVFRVFLREYHNICVQTLKKSNHDIQSATDDIIFTSAQNSQLNMFLDATTGEVKFKLQRSTHSRSLLPPASSSEPCTPHLLPPFVPLSLLSLSCFTHHCCRAHRDVISPPLPLPHAVSSSSAFSFLRALGCVVRVNWWVVVQQLSVCMHVCLSDKWRETWGMRTAVS